MNGTEPEQGLATTTLLRAQCVRARPPEVRRALARQQQWRRQRREGQPLHVDTGRGGGATGLRLRGRQAKGRFQERLQQRLLAVGERLQELCWRLQSGWRGADRTTGLQAVGKDTPCFWRVHAAVRSLDIGPCAAGTGVQGRAEMATGGGRGARHLRTLYHSP